MSEWAQLAIIIGFGILYVGAVIMGITWLFVTFSVAIIPVLWLIAIAVGIVAVVFILDALYTAVYQPVVAFLDALYQSVVASLDALYQIPGLKVSIFIFLVGYAMYVFSTIRRRLKERGIWMEEELIKWLWEERLMFSLLLVFLFLLIYVGIKLI